MLTYSGRPSKWPDKKGFIRNGRSQECCGSSKVDLQTVAALIAAPNSAIKAQAIRPFVGRQEMMPFASSVEIA